ncbi:similar to Saccharomyces cerevisiae YMR112C MED11 Subunit of the RNA polymerase II mediator complex [Geotrichum candidum]|uniref:Mediator of RNA polymerase II transcription subunit 11 n=1 Tax=Geotrichum candidum TaxID=1173061 RepID=A0A0J9XIB0_GEOCN|nr:similar to Saccharomyces cerevisiae YMR112C MED11 Subunit of the RNA polymerase II mediator complex [Geotrichum candidum]
MAIEDVEKRLSALHELDKKIIQLLETASASINHLKAGKTAPDMLASQQAREKFSTAVAQYYRTLEDVTVGVRREILLLNNVSKDKVLPISIVPKAEWVGHVKEEETWREVDALLEKSD